MSASDGARRVRADAGADVEDAPAQPRSRAIDQPLVVGGRPGHRVQVVGEGLRHAWEDRGDAHLRPHHVLPAEPEDVAGRFVADAVEHLRAAGVAVDVVSPACFRHFGIAYGNGIVQNLRARPWLALLLPAFLASFAAAARRSARRRRGARALASVGNRGARDRQAVRPPGVGDGRRARAPRAVARAPFLRRARLVVAASPFLAEEARALGAVRCA